MLVSLLLLVAIMVALLILYRSNGFVYILMTYLFGISTNIIFGTLYTAKLGITTRNLGPGSSFLIDYLSRVQVRFPLIVLGWNISFLIIFVSVILYVRYITRSSWKLTSFLCFICLVFVVSSDSVISRNLFIAINTSSALNEGILIKTLQSVQLSILTLFMIVPFVCVIYKFVTSRVYVKRADVVISGASILLLHLFMNFMLFLGIFRPIMVYNVTLLKFPSSYSSISDFYFTTLLLWLIVIIITTSFVGFRPFRTREKYIGYFFNFNRDKSNKKLGMLLHMYKNAFIGINQQLDLAKHNLEVGNTERTIKNIETGSQITNSYISMLNKALTVIGRPSMKFETINIAECINKSVEKSGIDLNKINVINRVDSDIIINGDRIHLEEVFLNLFLNAYEALSRSKFDNKRITISSIVEDDLVQINFHDNGIGIKRENQKKIFNTLYSSKIGVNGGFGLPYVVTVIRYHMGNIRVKSVFNKYTEFQIVFPINKFNVRG